MTAGTDRSTGSSPTVETSIGGAAPTGAASTVLTIDDSVGYLGPQGA